MPKPCILVHVGTAFGRQGLPGASVNSSRQKIVKTLHEDDSWAFIFTDPGDSLTVESIDEALPVTVTNHTSVPLAFETRLRDGDTLDDVLKQGRRYHLAYGSRIKITI